MTTHTSPEFRKILLEAGWSAEQIDDSEAIAIAREVRSLKQEGVTAATAASDSGGIVGAGAGNHEQIAAELEAERKKPATSDSMARRKKLRGQLDEAIGDVQVTFTR